MKAPLPLRKTACSGLQLRTCLSCSVENRSEEGGGKIWTEQAWSGESGTKSLPTQAWNTWWADVVESCLRVTMVQNPIGFGDRLAMERWRKKKESKMVHRLLPVPV